MARKTRMVLNREALHEIDATAVKGLELIAFRIIEKVDPLIPDATKGYGYIGGTRFERRAGEGLVERGAGWLSYVDGKKVGGDPRVRRKPRAFKVRGMGASVLVGIGFPARFIETGTVQQPPRPFFAPVVMSVVGDRQAVERAMVRAFADILLKKQRRLERKHNLRNTALLR